MPSLLGLPKELRDEIFNHAFSTQSGWTVSGYGDFRKKTQESFQDGAREDSVMYSPCVSPCILHTCKNIHIETTPRLYENVYLCVTHPDQVLPWLDTIGPKNSSAIRHLMLKFNNVPPVEYREDRHTQMRQQAWRSKLLSLPNICSLTFELAQDKRLRSTLLERSPFEEDIFPHDPIVTYELAVSALAWAKVLQPSRGNENQISKFTPELNKERTNHAMLAFGEPMPSVLSNHFASLLIHSTDVSLEQIMTGLPISFFNDSGFEPASTYAFNEEKWNPSVTISYSKLAHKPPSPAIKLDKILEQLPGLIYLRLGCRDIDSSFLTRLPSQIRTLDVAFTDTNPANIASNLWGMRSHCEKLLTVAIAVSPLHDRDADDNTRGVFFNRESVSQETKMHWKPFWDMLDSIKDTNVRVWEGEGPGFKRGKALKSP